MTFKIFHWMIRLMGLAALGLGMGLWANRAQLQDPPPPLLLEASQPAEAQPAAERDPAILRRRLVEINPAALNAGVGDRMLVNLFDDAFFNANITQAQRQPDGSGAWWGRLEGFELGQLTLVEGGGLIEASINTGSALYQIRSAGGGLHEVVQIDQAALPPEGEPIPVGAPEGEQPQAVQPAGVLADDGSVIDVMVAYTPAARTAAGGVTAMQNKINLAIQETNQSYQNSGVNQRVNLVHSVEVSYTESADFSTDLSRLANTSDGHMDVVHTLRNTYAADEVVLIRSASSTLCGIAYLMANVSTSFASSAFAVVSVSCATGYYSFGHEMGHNMGAHHDWYVNTSIAPYTYNHGYLNTTNWWRTVMAYDAECVARGGNCTRILYWSNPNVTYGGVPMGVQPNTSTACALNDVNHPACDADNRRVLNNTAYTVANFRVRPTTATSTPTPTPVPANTSTPTPTATNTPIPTATSTPTATPLPTSSAPILLVDDDDNGPDVRSYYTTALTNLGKTFDVWNTNNSDLEPSAAQLKPYSMVIWFTGDEWGGSAGPGAAGESALGSWLDNSGCLAISSQEYLYDRTATTFIKTYLGLENYTNDQGHTSVDGQGSVFGAFGALSLSYPFTNYSDAINPAAGAEAAFNSPLGNAAINKAAPAYRTAFFAYPLEALSLPDRQAVLAQFLGACQFFQTWLPNVGK